MRPHPVGSTHAARMYDGATIEDCIAHAEQHAPKDTPIYYTKASGDWEWFCLADDNLRAENATLRAQRDRLAAIIRDSFYNGAFRTSDAADILAEIEMEVQRG